MLGEENEVSYNLSFFSLGAFHNYWNISKHNFVLQMWKKGTVSCGRSTEVKPRNS